MPSVHRKRSKKCSSAIRRKGARVEFEAEAAASGWAAPPTKSWLQATLDEASSTHFGPSSAAMGEGGTIPFMGMLSERFPNAQFMISGLLGHIVVHMRLRAGEVAASSPRASYFVRVLFRNAERSTPSIKYSGTNVT